MESILSLEMPNTILAQTGDQIISKSSLNNFNSYVFSHFHLDFYIDELYLEKNYLLSSNLEKNELLRVALVEARSSHMQKKKQTQVYGAKNMV